jgi:hypothetical protein
MQHARSTLSTARKLVVTTKAARRSARGKYWLAWRAAMMFGIAAVAYIVAIVRGAH